MLQSKKSAQIPNPDDLKPIGDALNLLESPLKARDALREMGDYPPVEKPNSVERPGHYPSPDPTERFSLEAAIQWLSTGSEHWQSQVVYGFQGDNWYAVHRDGRVSAISSLFDYTNGLDNRADALQKARELGFSIL